jgi:flagellar M-ring protein FliF
MSLIQIGVLALVTLFLGLFVLRPILRAAPAAPQLSAPHDAGLPAPREGVQATENPRATAARGDQKPRAAQPDAGRVLTGEVTDSDDIPAAARTLSAPEQTLDPVTRLRQLIKERETETMEILSSWINDSEEVR